MITQFSLINEYGQSYTLNSLDTGYFMSPKGMGYEMSYGYLRIGSSWVRNYLYDKQLKMEGEITFATSDPYSEQTKLLKFIRTSAKLSLKRTTSAGTYYKDVDLVEYDISMIEDRALKCPVTLMPRTLWYATASATYSVSTGGGDGMKYPYRFPVKFKGTAAGELNITNDGSVSAPFTVSFTGPIVNPVLVLMQDGTEIARCAITGEAAEGESIEFSTVDGELYCYQKTAAGNVSLTSDFDIENDNFFKIPVGAYTIKITADAEITKTVTFNVRRLYKAV